MNRLFEWDRHKRYLALLLTELAKAFPEKIAFKGGTCAYFFYNLPRFSFDLDFDMILAFKAMDVDLFREIVARHGQARRSRGVSRNQNKLAADRSYKTFRFHSFLRNPYLT